MRLEQFVTSEKKLDTPGKTTNRRSKVAKRTSLQITAMLLPGKNIKARTFSETLKFPKNLTFYSICKWQLHYGRFGEDGW